MKTHIVGGNGLVGRGITRVLSTSHEVATFGRSDYDPDQMVFADKNFYNAEVIIHAAGVTDELIEQNFEFALKMCTKFITNLVNNIKKTKVNFFVYISTIHVYGRLNSILDCSTPASPLSIYGILHLLTEKLLTQALTGSTTKLLILRVPTVYGVLDPTAAITRPKIIQNSFPIELLTDGVIKLNSSGEQYRTFVSSDKIGLIIQYWLSEKLDNFCIVTPVKGRNLKVKDFASLCIDAFEEGRCDLNRLMINKYDSHEDEIETEIQPFFDSDETYSVEEYLTDFFRSMRL